MSASALKIAAVWTFVAVLAAACSSVGVDKSSANASASGAGGASTASSASASGSTSSDVGGAIGFGGFPATSATSGGEGGAGGSPAMPGLFDCNGCLCDGATHYCELVSGGKAPGPPPGPPPQPMCPEDAGAIRCKPIPAECLPMATCKCVDPQQGPCTCTVDPQGITVTCNLP
jgi:hypothetical protein